MSDYRWLTPASKAFLEKDYLLPGQTLDQRVGQICDTASRILKMPEFGPRFYENFKKGWYSFSTPIWTNFGTTRGMPISCYGSTVADTTASILYTQAEVSMMSKLGGGTSVYLGNLRGRGAPIRDNGESSGAVHFAQLFETDIKVWSQGSTRRGNCAIYLPIDHADIMEFLTCRSEGSPIQDLSTGVCVPDYWIEEMQAGDLAKRRIWARLLESRASTGYPYLTFVDNANRGTADVYRHKDLKITHSQLCNEVLLPDGEEESFVCDLSSMNVLYFDEWRNTDAVDLLVYLLDAVMTEFIEKSRDIPFMKRAVRFAERHRALGIGWLGWHSYLQSKGLPFESMEAKLHNTTLAKLILGRAYKASNDLASLFGEPELLKGYGRRNTTLLAIAPTKSSSFILGQASEGIEPYRSNYYVKDLAKGKFTVKNPYLQQLLEDKGENTSAVWASILAAGGSVQHLDFLTDHEKSIFKTFSEISPTEVIIQAAQRQKYIDQGQSLNLMIHPETPARDVNALVLRAWELGLKGLYYQISVNAAQQFGRDVLLSCKSCEA